MNKRFVIYTIITGGYNNILQPIVVDERFDYILFSNDFQCKHIGVWEIRGIPTVVNSNDNKRLSRYPKSHPDEMLSEYDASLYIDANIQIAERGIYERVIELYKKGVIYAGIKLNISNRDCIYDHALDMCMMGVEHDYVAASQCHELYKRGFPRHYGLNENNVMYRRHCAEMKIVNEEWWWWITNYSFRDQFSFMYCLWKNNIPNVYLLPSEHDTRTSTYFNFIEHNSNIVVKKRKFIKKGIMEIWRNSCYVYVSELTDKWFDVISSNDPQKALNRFGIYAILRFTPQLCINLYMRIQNKIVRHVIK